MNDGSITVPDDDDDDVGYSVMLSPRNGNDDPHPDPSGLGWPPTLAIEVALKSTPIKDICAAYNISREEWDNIRANPVFIVELGHAVEAMKTEGMPFKARSQLQANALLKESWKIIHDVMTPANVKADLIKSTIRWSGLDASKDASLAGAKAGAGFMIQINLGDR